MKKLKKVEVKTISAKVKRLYRKEITHNAALRELYKSDDRAGIMHGFNNPFISRSMVCIFEV
jgi:hypothetical protein